MAGGNQLALRTVGSHDHGPDPPRSRGRQHGGAGAVAEQRRGGPVVGIDDPAHEIGADEQHRLRAAGIDHPGAKSKSGQEPGAGGAHVDRAGAVRAQAVGNHRGRVGEQVVRGEGGDEHEVHGSRVHARALERLRTGVRGQGGQALVRSRPPALAHAGARHDPIRLDAEPRGDLRRLDPLLGHGAAERGDPGAPGQRLAALRALRGRVAVAGLCTGRLQLRGSLGLDAVQGPPHEPRQDLARPGLEEPPHAVLVEALRAPPPSRRAA